MRQTLVEACGLRLRFPRTLLPGPGWGEGGMQWRDGGHEPMMAAELIRNIEPVSLVREVLGRAGARGVIRASEDVCVNLSTKIQKFYTLYTQNVPVHEPGAPARVPIL